MSDKIEPASPQPRYINDDTQTPPGMSLRDYFAAAALQGMLPDLGILYYDDAKMATWAYRLADAMLRERAKHGAD